MLYSLRLKGRIYKVAGKSINGCLFVVVPLPEGGDVAMPAALCAGEGKEIVCQEVPHHHKAGGDYLTPPKSPLQLLVEDIENKRVETQSDERHSKELHVLNAYLFRLALPCPDAVEHIVGGSRQHKTDGVGQELLHIQLFLEQPCGAKVDAGARHAHHAKLKEAQEECLK